MRAFALQPSGRNCSPPPDLVIWSSIFSQVFFSEGMLSFHRHRHHGGAQKRCVVRGAGRVAGARTALALGSSIIITNNDTNDNYNKCTMITSINVIIIIIVIIIIASSSSSSSSSSSRSSSRSSKCTITIAIRNVFILLCSMFVTVLVLISMIMRALPWPRGSASWIISSMIVIVIIIIIITIIITCSIIIIIISIIIMISSSLYMIMNSMID